MNKVIQKGVMFVMIVFLITEFIPDYLSQQALATMIGLELGNRNGGHTR